MPRRARRPAGRAEPRRRAEAGAADAARRDICPRCRGPWRDGHQIAVQHWPGYPYRLIVKIPPPPRRGDGRPSWTDCELYEFVADAFDRAWTIAHAAGITLGAIGFETNEMTAEYGQSLD